MSCWAEAIGLVDRSKGVSCTAHVLQASSSRSIADDIQALKLRFNAQGVSYAGAVITAEDSRGFDVKVCEIAEDIPRLVTLDLSKLSQRISPISSLISVISRVWWLCILACFLKELGSVYLLLQFGVLHEYGLFVAWVLECLKRSPEFV